MTDDFDMARDLALPFMVKRLAGHQVITLAKAFTVVTNLAVSEMTREDERAVAHTLRCLGYEERWVKKAEGPGFGFLWTRAPWEIDAHVNAKRETESFVPFD